jgi:hypothetical protein
MSIVRACIKRKPGIGGCPTGTIGRVKEIETEREGCSFRTGCPTRDTVPIRNRSHVIPRRISRKRYGVGSNRRHTGIGNRDITTHRNKYRDARAVGNEKLSIRTGRRGLDGARAIAVENTITRECSGASTSLSHTKL